MASTVTATHPITGEIRKRTSKTMTYTHAVWIEIEGGQAYSWPNYRVPKTRSYLAYDVKAGSSITRAESGILSFHTSLAAATKAKDAYLASRRINGKAEFKVSAGVVEIDA